MDGILKRLAFIAWTRKENACLRPADVPLRIRWRGQTLRWPTTDEQLTPNAFADNGTLARHMLVKKGGIMRRIRACGLARSGSS